MAAKHAQRAMLRALRLELLGEPVRVTEVAPGMVETEFSLVRFGGDEEAARRVYEGMRPLSAEDVAECIRWARRPAAARQRRRDRRPAARPGRSDRGSPRRLTPPSPPAADRLPPGTRPGPRKGRLVKLVIGIVRPEKANDVLEALYRAEVRGVSMSRVAGPRGRARAGRDLPRDDRQGRPRGQGPLRDRGLRRVRRPDRRGALRGRPDRRGRRRQDLRPAARARGADPHRRDRPRRP